MAKTTQTPLDAARALPAVDSDPAVHAALVKLGELHRQRHALSQEVAQINASLTDNGFKVTQAKRQAAVARVLASPSAALDSLTADAATLQRRRQELWARLDVVEEAIRQHTESTVNPARNAAVAALEPRAFAEVLRPLIRDVASAHATLRRAVADLIAARDEVRDRGLPPRDDVWPGFAPDGTIRDHRSAVKEAARWLVASGLADPGEGPAKLTPAEAAVE